MSIEKNTLDDITKQIFENFDQKIASTNVDGNILRNDIFEL